MLLVSLLEHSHSKKQTIRIVNYIGDEKEKFDELVRICCGDDQKLAQRASWSLTFCVEKNPDFIKKHLKKMFKYIQSPVHNSLRRNFIKLLEYTDVPELVEADIISVCFEFLNKKDEFPAIKVYSMSTLFRFCKKYPDLSGELKAIITEQMQFEKPAFKSRGRKILNQLLHNRY